MAGLLMALCLRQPDFGSAVVLLFLTFALLACGADRLPARRRFRGSVLAAWAVRFTWYRHVRIIAWREMSSIARSRISHFSR
jgi:cell division protein FtsW